MIDTLYHRHPEVVAALDAWIDADYQEDEIDVVIRAARSLTA